MDPKTVSSLDPKLKEVYDRVMGTANPQASPPPQTTPQPAVPPTQSTPVAVNGGLSASPFPSTTNPVTPQPAPAKDNTLPKPAQATPAAPTPLGAPTTATPAPAASPEPAHQSMTTPMGKPVVDYAALAAKYATPTPPVTAMPGARAAVVTPSSTTYGVVNNDSTAKSQEKEKSDRSPLKKILLLVGLPVALLAYAIVWIFIFHIDVMALLPLAK